MLKPDLLIPDEDVDRGHDQAGPRHRGQPAPGARAAGGPREETGHFGTLLMGGHDWDRPALWRRSMELLATEVMPKFSQHAVAPRP